MTSVREPRESEPAGRRAVGRGSPSTDASGGATGETGVLLMLLAAGVALYLLTWLAAGPPTARDGPAAVPSGGSTGP
jgi:hypothetical protein